MDSRIKRVLTTSLFAALISGAILSGPAQGVKEVFAAETESEVSAPRRHSYPWNFKKTIDSESVVSFAKEYLGCRYVYGGSGPKVFDCSGFTMYVMGNFGIKLPHSARQQSSFGVRVARAKLRPGDLVFFASPGRSKISHVGMYVGDGSFIHASSGSGRVKINSLSDSYYDRYYAGAVRLFR